MQDGGILQGPRPNQFGTTMHAATTEIVVMIGITETIGITGMKGITLMIGMSGIMRIS